MYAANDASVINASVEFDEKTLQPTYRCCSASPELRPASRSPAASASTRRCHRHRPRKSRRLRPRSRGIPSQTPKRDPTGRGPPHRSRRGTRGRRHEIRRARDRGRQKRKDRQKEFESQLAHAVDEFDRQSKAFLKTIEDKALKNRLEKERLSRKAELNRAVVSKVARSEATAAVAGSVPPARQQGASGAPLLTKEGWQCRLRQGGVVLPISVGSNVITTFGNIGTVERIDDDVAQVLVGSIHLREKIADLSYPRNRRVSGEPSSQRKHPRQRASTDPSTPPTSPPSSTSSAKPPPTPSTSSTASSTKPTCPALPRVRIIHGFGTGALKNYVHHFLKNRDLVEKFAIRPRLPRRPRRYNCGVETMIRTFFSIFFAVLV